MTCQQCLAELATGSLRNLTPESAVAQHCATCPDCGPLATLLRDREYNAATVLNNLPPMSNPISVAENAALVARRRRLGKVAVYITGGALVATIWLSVFLTVGRDMIGDGPVTSSIRTETIQLSCLSPQQAGDIIEPYIRSRGGRYYAGNSGLKVITVRGTADEVAKSRELIQAFESDPQAACRHTPADMVDEMLKRFGGPPPTSGTDVAPTPDAAPKSDGAPKGRGPTTDQKQ